MDSSKSLGKVYLVGAGPGDPGLITVRGREILGRADAILVDGLVSPMMRSYARPEAAWISVGKHGGERLWKQSEIDDAIVSHARTGACVVRLKGGDTGVFARSAEELSRLTREGIPFEVIPGITAALAAAAYTGIPLTHRDWASGVALVTGQLQATDGLRDDAESVDWKRLANFPGTIVIYMGVTTGPQWSRELIIGGLSPDTPVAIVRRCSWPDQTVLRCKLSQVGEYLSSGSTIRPPVLAIVGYAASLGEEFDWYSRRPLMGKCILVTRPQASDDSWQVVLRELGARVVEQPALEIKPMDDFAKLDEAIADLSSFDWIVFSSTHGVDYFFQRLFHRGFDGRKLANAKLAGVGPSIREALTRWHLICDQIPESPNQNWNAGLLAETLVAKFDTLERKQRCLVVKADRGRPTLESELARAGHNVSSIAVYQNADCSSADPTVKELLRNGDVDYLLVSSPNSARSLIAMFGELLTKATLVCISDNAAAPMLDAGVSRVLIAQRSDFASMVEKILDDVQRST